jgi:hypothetical protein
VGLFINDMNEKRFVEAFLNWISPGESKRSNNFNHGYSANNPKADLDWIFSGI